MTRISRPRWCGTESALRGAGRGDAVAVWGLGRRGASLRRLERPQLRDRELGPFRMRAARPEARSARLLARVVGAGSLFEVSGVSHRGQACVAAWAARVHPARSCLRGNLPALPQGLLTRAWPFSHAKDQPPVQP